MKNLLALMLLCFFCVNAHAQIELGKTAEWNSVAGQFYSTGGAFADINGDGWLDFVVSCGNDMARSRVMVFYFDSLAMKYNKSPDWQSDDIDYHGHLSIADVNKDGRPDVAVSVYLGTGRFQSAGKIKLYMNTGTELEKTPSWTSRDELYTFSCSFGDANGDGYPDLAAATGESYDEKPDHVRIFFNHNGVLADSSEWQCADAGYAMDVHWADVNSDGRLDLVCAYERSKNRIYLNQGSTLETTPSWLSADVSYGNSIASGDINSDGLIDLVFTQNCQIGGDGKFQIYLNKGDHFAQSPDFVSAEGAYYSGAALADLTGDGQPELLIGSWGYPATGIANAPLEIYENHSGSYSSVPEWKSSSKGISEVIVAADPERKMIKRATQKVIKRENGGTAYYFDHSPIERIVSVSSRSASVLPLHYCFDRENGWISFAPEAFSANDIDIVYEYSTRLDVAYTNWSRNGNFIFHNDKQLHAAPESAANRLLVAPCPAGDNIKVSSSNAISQRVKYSIFNIGGAKVLTGEAFANGEGEFSVQVNSLPQGSYTLETIVGDRADSCKFVIQR